MFFQTDFATEADQPRQPNQQLSSEKTNNTFFFIQGLWGIVLKYFSVLEGVRSLTLTNHPLGCEPWQARPGSLTSCVWVLPSRPVTWETNGVQPYNSCMQLPWRGGVWFVYCDFWSCLANNLYSCRWLGLTRDWIFVVRCHTGLFNVSVWSLLMGIQVMMITNMCSQVARRLHWRVKCSMYAM